MSKHTPGPWKVVDSKYESGTPFKSIERRDGKSKSMIAILPDRCPSPAQWGPNADLIAAAPDLLETLKRVLKLVEQGMLVRDTSKDHHPDWALSATKMVLDLKAAHDAVAKAEGA